MPLFAPTRFIVIGLALAVLPLTQSSLVAQTNPSPSTLPATPATTPPPPETPLRPSQMPPNRAQIVYSNGILSVSADNSSLNQILRQIATDIGLKITGSVADER